jgi:LPXTG-motif cell wall-anchored protein
MLKRIAVLGVAAIGLWAAPVAAQQYPPHVNIVTANSPCPGASATISGTVTDSAGQPLKDTTVTVTLDGATIGTPKSDDAGKYSVSTTAPSQVGDHPVVATAEGATPVNATLKVVSCEGAPAAPRPDLPKTGSSNNTMTMVKVGIGLAAFGAALLAVAQKRRRQTAVA